MNELAMSHAPSDLEPRPGADPRWRAVLARDARQDGRFVFGVRSTGIYCRPSCPARKPRKNQVVFFPDADAAEHAGFRSCKRCRPRDTAPHPHAGLVRRVCAHIEERAAEERVTLEALARVARMSPHHLQRTFRSATGISPRQYADAVRLTALKERLRRKEPVTMAMTEAGYGSSSRLYERSPEALGMTPGDYRAGGAGAKIAYTVAKSPIGALLVAATDRGVCSLKIGGEDASLARALREEFPAAELKRDEAALGRWVRAIVNHLSGKETRLDLPLDIRATAFQQRVWEALRAIPYGETRTYQEIARIVGAPKAARAVGHACATNPVAILIPCHRVVRGDGTLGGYAYGLHVKRKLIDVERARSARSGATSRGPKRARPGR
ncbi:MAG TPA: bifunctional DNA-binding transcriptional regulator/O6-methylguanine-DNA methyltransferase Ada [Candidatus Omnitrophota bacterium]|nr:bifunctional DNA-binding transcriptional regulator/O6-methylguanine-DNA methyltransferase Ada [Candidatus Omnitrophota bacterium]